VSDDKKKQLLLWSGVKLSKDMKCVFNYNPAFLQSGANFLIANVFLPGFINRAHIFQLLFLIGMMHIWIWIPNLGSEYVNGTRTLIEVNNMMVVGCYENIAALSRFVLGLFVSLALAKTYYSNRGMFGTVFGSSMGLAQMTVAWVRAPNDGIASKTSAATGRELLVRWINAAFRLMWLEAVPGKTPDDIGKDMLGAGVLTKAEWEYIKDLPSRCTHIYQWMNNVVLDLHKKCYIARPEFVVQMNTQIDLMRGANVWGLPSLPIAYTMIITNMVKLHVLMLALKNGAMVLKVLDGDVVNWFAIILLHLDTVVHNYLYQGLLDLHGALYNPNSGELVGHLPAVNFLDFVRTVTEDLLKNTPDKDDSILPYKLELADIADTGTRKQVKIASPDELLLMVQNMA